MFSWKTENQMVSHFCTIVGMATDFALPLRSVHQGLSVAGYLTKFGNFNNCFSKIYLGGAETSPAHVMSIEIFWFTIVSWVSAHGRLIINLHFSPYWALTVCKNWNRRGQFMGMVLAWYMRMRAWLTLLGRLPGSGCFPFKQPKQLHGRLPESGRLPGTLRYVYLPYIISYFNDLHILTVHVHLFYVVILQREIRKGELWRHQQRVESYEVNILRRV